MDRNIAVEWSGLHPLRSSSPAINWGETWAFVRITACRAGQTWSFTGRTIWDARPRRLEADASLIERARKEAERLRRRHRACNGRARAA